jgi:hypothetical protein
MSSSFGFCPACALSHNNPQLVSSLGETADYSICLKNAKIVSQDFEDKQAQKEFIKCTLEFIKDHSKECCDARKNKNKELPVITKPFFVYNTAADQDSWRRNSY